jgi:hypothetical protein
VDWVHRYFTDRIFSFVLATEEPLIPELNTFDRAIEQFFRWRQIPADSPEPTPDCQCYGRRGSGIPRVPQIAPRASGPAELEQG